jgi:heme ABC exporter ATP-binding subunit CcmA
VPTLDFTSLSFSDVSRHFGRRRALHRATFRCGAGEVVAVLGPNGAGKSTLLAIAATLLAPSTGEVRYGDHDAAADGAALRGRIGVLGHDLFLYPELTARENLAFFARLSGVAAVPARVDEALARTGLASRADEPVSGFSRGMRQRVAIERALLHEPRLVLLDEPFTGLDEASAGLLTRRIAGLRQSGAIVLVTTHDLDTIEPIADRALLLLNGRLTELDAGPGTLRERYRRSVAAPAPPDAAARGAS